jgi:MerR family transcriptional regulator, copper efflux regulator
MHIGNVAERSGVPAKTIRYYESIGLIPSATRTGNGYRVYDELDLRTLQFIKRARGLGFPVNEVASLLALWHDRSRASAEVKQLAQKRIAHVERKIEELQTIKRALLDLAERCHGDDRPDCPIIDELAAGTD